MKFGRCFCTFFFAPALLLLHFFVDGLFLGCKIFLLGCRDIVFILPAATVVVSRFMHGRTHQQKRSVGV
jgi:hypothetical protein